MVPALYGIIGALRSGTNFNRFTFSDLSLFGEDFLGDGFNEFCEYFIEHNDRLLAIEMKNLSCCSLEANQSLVRLIQKSTSLSTINFHLTRAYKLEPKIIEILLESSVTTLIVH